MAKEKTQGKESTSPSRTSDGGRKLASGGKQEAPGQKVKTGTTDTAGSAKETKKSSDRS